MDTTMSEVVQFIQENDVKFIRLAFCDIFGNQKNIAIMPTELERAFEQGIHFNAAALRGFLNVEASDLAAVSRSGNAFRSAVAAGSGPCSALLLRHSLSGRHAVRGRRPSFAA